MKFRSLLASAALFLTGFSGVKAEVSVEGDTARFDGVSIKREDTFRVTGKIASSDGPRFSQGNVILHAQKINGRANQDDIEFHLVLPGGWEEAKRLKKGSWIEVTGQWRDAKLRGVRKIITLKVTAMKAAKPVSIRFADFVDRAATFKGVAAKGGGFKCGAETATLENLTDWPEGVTGKEVEVRGVLQREGKGWKFTAPSWHLERLADQVGREVELEGSIWSLNDGWWFDYRDERVCLIGEKGPVLTFKTSAHGATARVKGRLLKQLRPALDQFSTKEDRDLVPQFVIRVKEVKFLEEPLSDEERFRTVNATPQKIEDGIPVLVPESSYRINMLGNETMARLYVERNDQAIESILKAPAQAQVDVLAKRLAAERNARLRLVYAAMLAACNDGRGREALLNALKDRKAEIFPDALYCIGIFPFLPPKDTKLKTETAWAEETLAGLLAARTTREITSMPLAPKKAFEEEKTVAEASVLYASILQVLLRGKSEKGRAAVVEFALSGASGSTEAVDALCEDDAPLPLDVLTKLAGQPTERRPNRRVLQKMLKQRETAAVHLFGGVLTASDVYSDFREAMTPELAKAFKDELPNLPWDPTALAKMLIITQEKDPVAEWIKLLEDPECEKKNLVVWELAQLKDPRALEPVMRCLRKAKDGHFKSPDAFGSAPAVTGCFAIIAGPGGDQAVVNLIELLKLEFGRAKEDYMNDAGLRRIVAAHLIDLTGESFGMDAAAWKKWFESGKPQSQ